MCVSRSLDCAGEFDNWHTVKALKLFTMVLMFITCEPMIRNQIQKCNDSTYLTRRTFKDDVDTKDYNEG